MKDLGFHTMSFTNFKYIAQYTFAAIVPKPGEVVSFILGDIIRAAVPDDEISEDASQPKDAEPSVPREPVEKSSSVDAWAGDTIDFAAMGFSSGFAKFALPDKPKKSGVTITCDACNVTLNSEANMLAHVGGAKHKRKIAKLEGKDVPDRGPKARGKAATATESNIAAASPPELTKNHEKDAENISALEQTGAEEKVEVELHAEITTEEVSDEEIVCIDDDESPLTQMGLPTGFGGKHVEAPPKKDSVKYVCDICHVELNSEATMKIHIAGQKHIRAVAKLEGVQLPPETMKKVLEKSKEINEKVRQMAEKKRAEREAKKNANKVRKDEELRSALERCRQKGARSDSPNDGEVIEKIQGTKGFYCRACDVEMNSEQTMRTHEAGNKHSLAMGVNRRKQSKWQKRNDEFRPREYKPNHRPPQRHEEDSSEERRPHKRQRKRDSVAPRSPAPGDAGGLSDGEIMSEDDDAMSVTSVASVKKVDGKRYIDRSGGGGAEEFRPRERAKKRRHRSRSGSGERKRKHKRQSRSRSRSPLPPPRRERKKARRSPTRSPSPSPPPSSTARHDRMAEDFLSTVVLPSSSSGRKRQTSSLSSSRSSLPAPQPPHEVPSKGRKPKRAAASACYVEKRVHPSQELRLFERLRKVSEPVVGLQFVSEWLPCANRYLHPHYECDICRVGGKVDVIKAHLVGKAHREKFYEIAAGTPRNLGNMSRDRLWSVLGDYNDADRAKDKIETIYSDEQYPWPPNRAPWCEAAGGTGIVPTSARKNVRYRRKNYLLNDFQIVREQRIMEEVAAHKEENENNLCNVDPTTIGDITSKEELASYTDVLNSVLDKIKGFHAEEGGDGSEALKYLLSTVSKIVGDINDVPIVVPPTRDELIAAALMKGPALNLKQEIFTASTAAQSVAVMAPPAAVSAFANPQLPVVSTLPAPIPAAVPAPIAATFPTPVPSLNLDQVTPRRTLINLEVYKKKKVSAEVPVAATSQTMLDMTVPPPPLPSAIDIASELEYAATRDPRLRRK